MPRRFGLVGPIKRGRKSIVGGVLAGVAAAVAAAQQADVDGATLTIGALVTAAVTGFAVWWTSNAEED